MKFGEITHVTGMAFYVSQLSGILGLAYDSISVNKLPTFLDTASMKDKSFALYLALNPKDSFMTIPGFDKDLMKEREFQYHSVVEKKYYSLNLKNVGQRDQRIDTSGFKAVIDSGTSAIIGPADMIAKFVEGIFVHSDCANLSELPDLIFTIDDIEYVLEPQDYVIKVSLLGQSQCVMGIMPA